MISNIKSTDILPPKSGDNIGVDNRKSELQRSKGRTEDSGSASGAGSASFLDTLREVSKSAPSELHNSAQDRLRNNSNISGAFETDLNKSTNNSLRDNLKFSNHAIERLQSRGITLNKEDIAKLNDVIKKAAAKGSKDSLVLMKEAAFIVSVKNNTVVTVMDKNSLKENVFTNIDSTIVV